MNIYCPSCNDNPIYPFNYLCSTCKCLFIAVSNNNKHIYIWVRQIHTNDIPVGNPSFSGSYKFFLYPNLELTSYFNDYSNIVNIISSLNLQSHQDIINAIYKYKSLSSFI